MRNLVIAFILLLAAPAFAETPKLMARVNDYAGVLTPDQRSLLEKKLEGIEATEGHPQVAVILPATMDGLDIERYANETYHNWRLGQAGKDNGVLIVIAPKERKWRIEVGYGLESAIPDSRAKEILSKQMDPYLKGGKTGFYPALDAAVVAIGADFAKEKVAVVKPSSDSLDFSIAEGWMFVLILPIGMLLIWAFFRAGKREEEEFIATQKSFEPVYKQPVDYPGERFGGAMTDAAIGGGVGMAAVAAASTAKRREEEKKKRRSDDDSYSSSHSSSYGSGSSTSWGGSSSSSDSGSSSFSGGGGDSGGGGASSGD